MPRMKLFLIQTKVFKRLRAFGVIPGVGEKNSSNIPKNGANFRHGLNLPASLFIPLVIPSVLARNLLRPFECKQFFKSESVLVFVDGRRRMVIPPVEPIIFQRRNTGEAFSLRRPRHGAALEVPLAVSRRVEQSPGLLLGGCVGFCVSLKKKFGVLAVDPADENAERLAVGSEHKKQRRAVHLINNGRLLHERFPGISARRPSI